MKNCDLCQNERKVSLHAKDLDTGKVVCTGVMDCPDCCKKEDQSQTLTKREAIATQVFAALLTSSKPFNGDKAYCAVLYADNLLRELKS